MIICCEIYFQTESSFDAAQTCFFFSLAFAHLLFTRCWVAFLLADICLGELSGSVFSDKRPGFASL